MHQSFAMATIYSRRKEKKRLEIGSTQKNSPIGTEWDVYKHPI
jgi:hypothetical protein